MMQPPRTAVLVFSTLLMIATSVFAGEPVEPKVLGLMFHSDKCGSCKILDPKLQTAKNALSGEDLLFVTFDHTSDETRRQAALLADRLNVGDIYAAQGKASGFFLIVDAESGKVLQKITRTATEEEITQQLKDALTS